MSKVQTATDSVLDRVISLSSTATAEDAGYLASALEKTAGSGTIADIQQAGVDAQANLTNLADQKITEIQSLSSNNNSGLGDITVVDSAAIPLVTDESFTENTSAAYRCLVKENGNSNCYWRHKSYGTRSYRWTYY